MVLLIEKLAKHYFKLENRHHAAMTHPPQQPEELSSSLLAFKSHVSKTIDQLASDLKPGGGSETLSLAWFERCFGLFPFINKAFAKLVVDIDYPMSKWEIGSSSTEGYLSYTLSLLGLLNSISSCLSHLGQARLSLAHGLTLVEKENSPNSLARKHLKAIQFQFQQGCFSNNFKRDDDDDDDDDEAARVFSSGKEWIVHEAVKEMRSIGFWVCGVLLSCLYGDAKPYMELTKIAGAGGFDIKITEQLMMEKVPIFSEIKEVNDAVSVLVASDSDDEARHDDAANELQTKLRVLEKLSDDISKEVDTLFANVMSQRSELIDGFRLQKQPQNSVV